MLANGRRDVGYGTYDIPYTAEVQSHEARVFLIRQLSASPNGRSVSQ